MTPGNAIGAVSMAGRSVRDQTTRRPSGISMAPLLASCDLTCGHLGHRAGLPLTDNPVARGVGRDDAIIAPDDDHPTPAEVVHVLVLIVQLRDLFGTPNRLRDTGGGVAPVGHFVLEFDVNRTP